MFHAAFIGFISAGLAVLLKISSSSAPMLIPFSSNTLYTPFRNSEKLYGLCIALIVAYSGHVSCNLDSYSSSLLISSSPTSCIGHSMILWLSIGTHSSFIICSILSQYSFMYGFCLILSFTSGVSHVADVCTLSFIPSSTFVTFFSIHGNTKFHAVPPFGLAHAHIVLNGLCVNDR